MWYTQGELSINDIPEIIIFSSIWAVRNPKSLNLIGSLRALQRSGFSHPDPPYGQLSRLFQQFFFSLQRTLNVNNDLRNKEMQKNVTLNFLFPKCQTHAYPRFENGCSENSTQKLLTKYSTEEKNKHVICRPRLVRIGKNCALGLEYRPRPAASGRTQDLWQSFSQYGPPGRQITYIYSSAI